MGNKRLIIFLDSGDTLIDESSEIRDESGVVISAGTVPGAGEAVRTLYEKGYTLALVADGYAQSFKNVLKQNGIYQYLSAVTCSELVMAEKPSPRMFKAAMGALDLGESDRGRIVMVGNNLSRDIRGAKQMEIKSVFLSWTPRYPKEPSDESEVPDYIIRSPLELVELAEKLEKDLTA